MNKSVQVVLSGRRKRTISSKSVLTEVDAVAESGVGFAFSLLSLTRSSIGARLVSGGIHS